MNKRNIEQDMKMEKLGAKLYYTYRTFLLIVFLVNLYVTYYFIFKEQPKLLILSLVLNIIYALIYIRRELLILIAGGLIYYFYKDIFHAICIGFAIGNGISYIIDLIRRTIFRLIIRILEWANSK
jgi:hypothetical protein